jgi:hypothetical protein
MGFEIMRNGIVISMAAGLTFATAGAAGAQVTSAPGVPLPGAGDSTRISSDNREASAAYNQRMGAADLKPNADGRKKRGPVRATAEDIKAGATVRDIKGVAIGTVDSVDAAQAVVNTGQTKIGVPLIGFGKDDHGLLINMTADKFNQLVAQAHAKSQAQDQN